MHRSKLSGVANLFVLRFVDGFRSSLKVYHILICASLEAVHPQEYGRAYIVYGSMIHRVMYTISNKFYDVEFYLVNPFSPLKMKF